MSIVESKKVAPSAVVLVDDPRPRTLVICEKGDFVGCFIGREEKLCQDCPLLGTRDCTIEFRKEVHELRGHLTAEQQETLWDLPQPAIREHDKRTFVQTDVGEERILSEVCPVCIKAQQDLESIQKLAQIRKIIKLLKYRMAATTYLERIFTEAAQKYAVSKAHLQAIAYLESWGVSASSTAKNQGQANCAEKKPDQKHKTD